MNSQEPIPDDRPPKWFEKWFEKEEERRARRAQSEGGLNIFTIGLGGLAVAASLAALKDISTVTVAQILLISMFAMGLGVAITFSSLLVAAWKK